VLVDKLSLRYSDTYPIPLDLDAINAYKSQRIPYIAYPASIFSYSTLVAFSNLMKTVTVRWPEEATRRWNQLGNLCKSCPTIVYDVPWEIWAQGVVG
jgi:hypothetical protein